MGNRMGTRRIDLHTLHDGDVLRWNDTTKRLEGYSPGELGIEDVPENLVTSDDISSIVQLTQVEYDALDPPVATTLYVIVG